ncbi:substrate-binding domain-containing protein [Arthrobacter sp. D1-17]
MSVAGFDDQPEAAYFVPPLTTANQGFRELDERCIRMLLSHMAHGHSAAASVLNPKLVVRGSTAAPTGCGRSPGSSSLTVRRRSRTFTQRCGTVVVLTRRCSIRERPYRPPGPVRPWPWSLRWRAGWSSA